MNKSEFITHIADQHKCTKVAIDRGYNVNYYYVNVNLTELVKEL